MNVADLIITSLETITAFDVTTGDYKFTLDELQNATIEQTMDSEDITGKAGRKLATLKRNKAVSISGTNGLLSGGLLETQTGGTFETGKTTKILWTDYLTVKSNAATTTYTAVGTAGSEIESIYVKENGVLTTKLEQADAAASGKFAYDPATKALTFSGLTENTEIVVHYMRQISADVLTNPSGSLAGKATLYIDALAEDTCANTYRVQFFIPKADFSAEFSIELGDSQTVHEFSADALAGGCGLGSNFWTYTVFGTTAEDVA